jgi:hypothetical protein
MVGQLWLRFRAAPGTIADRRSSSKSGKIGLAADAASFCLRCQFAFEKSSYREAISTTAPGYVRPRVVERDGPETWIGAVTTCIAGSLTNVVAPLISLGPIRE